MATITRPTLHRDGTVTYWSVYEQRWRNRTAHYPDRELAALPRAQRRRVIHHLGMTEDEDVLEQRLDHSSR